MESEFYKWLKHRLYIAFYEAKAGKQGTADEYVFELNLETNMRQLTDDIYYRMYKPSRGIAFLISQPVMREIFAAPFRDRVVHHFLYDMSADWWDKRLDYDAYSCRKGKGTLFGVRRLEHHIASVSENYTKEAYAIQLDIQGYFMSLDRRALVKRVEWGLAKQFDAGSPMYDLLDYLWKEVILDDPTDGVKIRGNISDWDKLPANKSLFCQPPGKGIVIGNLSSQLLSNIYLGQLDMFIRQELGYSHYGRYVDDFFLIVPSAELTTAKENIRVIERYLADELGLVLHPKKRHIQEVRKGVAFLGMVVYPHHTVPGRRMNRNFHQAMRETIEGVREVESVISYLGRLKHCNGQKFAERVFRHNGLEYNF